MPGSGSRSCCSIRGLIIFSRLTFGKQLRVTAAGVAKTKKMNPIGWQLFFKFNDKLPNESYFLHFRLLMTGA